MNTPAHAVLGLWALERGSRSGLAAWVLAGAVLPDVPNMVMFAIYRGLLGMPAEQVYAELYPSAVWQLALGPSHSFAIVGVGLVIATWRGNDRWCALLWSAALHLLLDLLTHGGDAHPHLWPLLDVRFDSPISYWDRSRHAAIFVPLELASAVAGSVVIWKRGDQWWRRVLLIGSCAWLAIAYASGLAFWGT